MEEQNSDCGQVRTKPCPYCHEMIHADAVKCRYCRSTLPPFQLGSGPHVEYPEKMLLGVCSNIAGRYAVPVTLVRLVFVLLTLFRGLGIIVYLILWAVLPGQTQEEAKVSTWYRAAGRIFDALKKAVRAECSGSRTDPPAQTT